jgi:hypothetical protein
LMFCPAAVSRASVFKKLHAYTKPTDDDKKCKEAFEKTFHREPEIARKGKERAAMQVGAAQEVDRGARTLLLAWLSRSIRRLTIGY